MGTRLSAARLRGRPEHVLTSAQRNTWRPGCWGHFRPRQADYWCGPGGHCAYVLSRRSGVLNYAEYGVEAGSRSQKRQVPLPVVKPVFRGNDEAIRFSDGNRRIGGCGSCLLTPLSGCPTEGVSQMRKLTKKSKVIAVAASVALVAVGGGTAYAYWTTTGSRHRYRRQLRRRRHRDPASQLRRRPGPGQLRARTYTADNSTNTGTVVGALTAKRDHERARVPAGMVHGQRHYLELPRRSEQHRHPGGVGNTGVPR